MQDADYLAGEKKNNFSHLLAFNFHFVNILADKPPHFPTPPLPSKMRGKTFALRYSLLIIEIIFLAAFEKLCHICLLRPSLKVCPWLDICLQGIRILVYFYLHSKAVGKSGLRPLALIYGSIK